MKIETFEGKVVSHRTEDYTAHGRMWTKYIVRFAIDNDKCSLVECKVNANQYSDLVIGKFFSVNAHLECKNTWTNSKGVEICLINLAVDDFTKIDKQEQSELDIECDDCSDDEKMYAEFLEFKRMMQNKNK